MPCRSTEINITKSSINAVTLSYASPKRMRGVAEDLSIADIILYNWLKKYTVAGSKTTIATFEEKLKALQLKNVELEIERDI